MLAENKICAVRRRLLEVSELTPYIFGEERQLFTCIYIAARMGAKVILFMTRAYVQHCTNGAIFKPFKVLLYNYVDFVYIGVQSNANSKLIDC